MHRVFIFIAILLCFMDNTLQNILKKMAVKEKKINEYKKRVHAKGEVIEKKMTKNGNMRIVVEGCKFIVMKSHKEKFKLAQGLSKGDLVYVSGIKKLRYVLCTRLKKIYHIDKSVQQRLC